MAELPAYIDIVFEDRLSEAVIDKLLTLAPVELAVNRRFPARGSGYIRKRIAMYNRVAEFQAYFVLADADTPECPKRVLESWLPEPRHRNCLFRLAVPTVEAWLVADREGIAAFLGISVANVTKGPDSLVDAKQHLLALAARSRSRRLREDLLPPVNGTARQGPSYNPAMIGFVKRHWHIESACANSQSLARAVRHVRGFRPSTPLVGGTTGWRQATP